MGSWSTSIMGGDTPLDIRCRFERLFGSDDRETAEEEKLPEFRLPSADESVAFMQATIAEWDWERDQIKQVTGFLVMARGAPMSGELRRLVIEGIDAEIATGAEEWDNPAERIAVLADFRTRVEAYPAEGGVVDLPDQPGLFEMIFKGQGG